MLDGGHNFVEVQGGTFASNIFILDVDQNVSHLVNYENNKKKYFVVISRTNLKT